MKTETQETTCGHPDPALCRRLKKHIHGRLWELYHSSPEHRAKWEAEADGRPYEPPRQVNPSGRYGHALVAPLGTKDCPPNWQGCAARKPWEYACTVMIPTIGMPDIASVAVGLLRHQTARPYFILVDTGSDDAAYRALEELRADDLEVHYVRGHGYQHSSAPVSVALDLGFAATQTDYLFLTHADVFARRKDWLAFMFGQCGPECPVVGWEQSPRGQDGWQGCVSHTSTMLYLPPLRAGGVCWSWRRYYARGGTPKGMTVGFPDTEQPFNACLADLKIKPKLLGTEFNFERQSTEWWDHARSWPGMRPYALTSPVYQKVEAYGRVCLAEAQARLAGWDAEASAKAPPASSQRGTCTHLGDPTGALRDCQSCRGTVKAKVFACRHPAHRETTLRECQACPDWRAKEGATL